MTRWHYINRMQGVAAWGCKLGMSGTMRVMMDGRYTNDAAFDLVVDEDARGSGGWVALGLFRPVHEGTPQEQQMSFVVFGDGQKRPFATPYLAMSFVQAFAVNLDGKDVDAMTVDGMAGQCGIEAFQYTEPEAGTVEQEEAVQVDVPTDRTLH